MWYIEDKFHVIIGGNTYINVPNIVVYKETPLFALKRQESDGMLGIDFDLFNNKGKRVATIRHNHIVQGNLDDYEFIREVNRYAVVEKATDRVILDIRRRSDAAPAELLVSVKLYTPDGFLFDATPECTNPSSPSRVCCLLELRQSRAS